MVVGLESWTLARPEIFLAAATLLLLVYGVVKGERSTPVVSVATSVVLLVTAVLLFAPYREGPAFASLFIVDRLTATMKAMVLIGAAVAVLLSRSYFEQVKAWRFEYPILVALATLGMMLMISANDLMALYVGLELQSLALYVIAAFQRDNVRSTEAGVKYFVLGSVASGMLLFGASLIYGFCGGTAFVQISRARDLDDAIEQCNATNFGLAASLFSDSDDEWREFFARVRAGCLNRNTGTAGASSKLPFGGLGRSGNHRPAGAFAIDACAYPVATMIDNADPPIPQGMLVDERLLR